MFETLTVVAHPSKLTSLKITRNFSKTCWIFFRLSFNIHSFTIKIKSSYLTVKPESNFLFFWVSFTLHVNIRIKQKNSMVTLEWKMWRNHNEKIIKLFYYHFYEVTFVWRLEKKKRSLVLFSWKLKFECLCAWHRRKTCFLERESTICKSNSGGWNLIFFMIIQALKAQSCQGKCRITFLVYWIFIWYHLMLKTPQELKWFTK